MGIRAWSYNLITKARFAEDLVRQSFRVMCFLGVEVEIQRAVVCQELINQDVTLAQELEKLRTSNAVLVCFLLLTAANSCLVAKGG